MYTPRGLGDTTTVESISPIGRVKLCLQQILQEKLELPEFHSLNGTVLQTVDTKLERLEG